MFQKHSFEEVKNQVEQILNQSPEMTVAQISSDMEISEAEVTLALPEEMVVKAQGIDAQTLLAMLPEWGRVTTIIHSQGSIFEVKAPFPKGKFAHGYYNLMGGDEGQLHGHLQLDLIEIIAFVSKPFHKMESHYIGFYDAQGRCVFKVYLGRDNKRRLLTPQVEKFAQLKRDFS